MEMKTEYTRKEFEEYIETIREDHDHIRLVSPEERKVCMMNGEVSDEICHNFWNRRERCENCTSNHALRLKSRVMKLETLKGQTYLVISKYVSVNGSPGVLEMISNVTGELLLDSDEKDKVAEIIRTFNHKLITDPLTGVYNRRFLDENFAPSLDCCFDKDTAVNIAMLDVDDFKGINDTYGHIAGDMLLKDIASFWKSLFDARKGGSEQIVGRLGGDEFVLISCGVEAGKFKKNIEEHYSNMRRICYYKKAAIPFSISIGYGCSSDFQGNWKWIDLVEAADHDMYAKKKKRACEILSVNRSSMIIEK